MAPVAGALVRGRIRRCAGVDVWGGTANRGNEVKTAGRIFLYFISLQSVILGHLYVGAALLFGFAREFAYEPGLVPTAEWRDWMDKKCPYSMTIGRGIIYKQAVRDDDPEIIDTPLERHERKHIWQQEDCCFVADLIALLVFIMTGDVAAALAVWASGVLWLLMYFITAGLRFGDWSHEGLYRNAEHERSAYAQTDLPRVLGKSWEELRELHSTEGKGR